MRENEPAAAALTVSPTRAKLIAFATAGYFAGMGGAALGGLAVEISYTQRFFRLEDSLAVVSAAVIGGLGSLAGAVVGALWVFGLPAFWPTNQTVPLLTSSIGLLIILLYVARRLHPVRVLAARHCVPLARTASRREQPAKTVTEPPHSLDAHCVGGAAAAQRRRQTSSRRASSP